MDSAVSTNKPIANSACVVSCLPAVTQQAVAPAMDALDTKPILSVGARGAIPKQRVILQNETLTTSHQNADAQCFPVGLVSTGTDGSHVAGLVQSDAVVLETIKGLSSAISKGLTLPKRNSPTFDSNPLHYGFMKSFEETVMKQVSDSALQLAYLIDMSWDKAYEATRSCNIINLQSEALKTAFDKFSSEFGHVVVMAHLDSIVKGPLIKAEESLDKPETGMVNCYLTLVHWDDISELNLSKPCMYLKGCLCIYRGNSVMELTLIQLVTQLCFLIYCLLLKTLQVVLIHCVT